MKERLWICVFAGMLAACSTQDNGDHGRVNTQQPTRLSTLSDLGKSSAGGNLTGSQIVVDLETAPDPRTSWGVAACQSVLPPDFIIGQATCDPDKTLTAPITAANAKQICSGNPQFGPSIGPSVALAIPGCTTLDLKAYAFAPSLGIGIQIQ